MTLLNKSLHRVTAFAPATCSNIAVGFDILGFAMSGVGDTVSLTRRDDAQIVVEKIDADESLPFDANKNTASVAIKHLCERQGIQAGFSIHIKKGIALGSGMGGSAASAVAAVVACNEFLSMPLSLTELAEYALMGEAIASGQAHGDNIVPALFGGFTLIRSIDPVQVLNLPVPNIYCVLVHPHLRIETKAARHILKETLLLKDYVHQSAHLASFIAALYIQDLNLLSAACTDLLIEPQRAHLVPGFYAAKTAAMKAGALGASFSGSGPSIFAFARDKVSGEAIAGAMRKVFEENGVETDIFISRISERGACVVGEE